MATNTRPNPVVGADPDVPGRHARPPVWPKVALAVLAGLLVAGAFAFLAVIASGQSSQIASLQAAA